MNFSQKYHFKKTASLNKSNFFCSNMHIQSINLLCKSEDKILPTSLLGQNMQVKLHDTIFFPCLINHKWNLLQVQLLHFLNLNSWQTTVSTYPQITANFSLFALPHTVQCQLDEQCTLILDHVTLTLGSNLAND